jgi:hypothetical protein
LFARPTFFIATSAPALPTLEFFAVRAGERFAVAAIFREHPAISLHTRELEFVICCKGMGEAPHEYALRKH